MKKVICIPKVFCLSVGVQIKLDKHAKIDNVYFKLKGDYELKTESRYKRTYV